MDDETLFQDIDTITNIVTDNCEPAILPSVYPQTINGKTIIVAQIPVGRQRPYYVKKLGMMEGTFIRISAETRQAPEYMVKELMFEGSGRFFDKTVCIELEADDRDISRLCRSLKKTARANCLEDADKRRVKDVTPAQLLSWGVLTQKDGKVVPTNAFALLTGHWRLPTMIQCALFKGTEKGVFLDRREFDGPIQNQQEEALQFVLRNIRLGARASTASIVRMSTKFHPWQFGNCSSTARCTAAISQGGTSRSPSSTTAWRSSARASCRWTRH